MVATPVMMPQSSMLLIILSGVIYALCAAAVQRKLSNPKKSRELQDQIKIISKELQAMIKNNAPKEEVSKRQSEMMPLVRQSMTMNMKSTFILIPSFFVVYYLIIPYLFGGLGTDFVAFMIGSYKISLEFKGLFFVTVFILGIILSVSILLYDKRRAKLDTKAKLEAEGIKP